MIENDIVRTLAQESEEFEKLVSEHRNLEQKLSEYQSRLYLTADEEMEKKKMQKMKLLRKDRMAEIIREYMQTHPSA